MFDYAKLPDPEMLNEVLFYVASGTHPGGFLLALLENDLVQTVLRADESNLARLRSWVLWMEAELPTAAWGSPEKVHRWMRARIDE